MNEILNIYKDVNIKMDLTKLYDVDSDNVCHRLNQATEGHFSYDTEIVSCAYHALKVTLYTPIKVVTGYAMLQTNTDLSEATKTALLHACKLGFDFREESISEIVANDQKFDNNKRPEDIAATTLEELEAIEKEIATGIVVKDEGLVEFKQDPPNTTTNPFGIREDQIDFMKKFQDKFKIDTTEKFDSYVTAWGHQQSMYSITTKKQLISCGPEAVDAFIAWIKEVYKDNSANNDFVCPSEDEFNECCK